MVILYQALSKYVNSRGGAGGDSKNKEKLYYQDLKLYYQGFQQVNEYKILVSR